MPPAPRAERISYGPRRVPGERAKPLAVDYTSRAAERTELLVWNDQNLATFDIAVIVLVARSNRLDDLRPLMTTCGRASRSRNARSAGPIGAGVSTMRL